jgi:hypothetical protein
MDQMHVDLWWQGINIAADAGTYLYNAPPPWDNPLVSSRVHNGLTVDGREQMTRGGRFMVLDWFPAWSEHMLSPHPPIMRQIRATHRGLAPLGLRHERTLSVLETGAWQIRDDVIFTRRRPHAIRLHWLLVDGNWQLEEDAAEIRLWVRLQNASFVATISHSGGIRPPLRASLIRAGQLLRGAAVAHPWEGWISSTYGRKVPALSLSVEAEAFATCSLTTEFRLMA